ncbi:MAG: ECF-type sigma factor [Calditrichia bacterium]
MMNSINWLNANCEGSVKPDTPLNATALVHEAYVKLIDQHRVDWQNRAHFMAIAAQSMRRILINYAKSRSAQNVAAACR